MTSFLFDPNANKVINDYGGFEPNERGIVQYPKRPLQGIESAQMHTRPGISEKPSPSVETDRFLDPIARHYRLFVQDPDQTNQERNDTASPVQFRVVSDGVVLIDEPKPITCGIQKLKHPANNSIIHPFKKPIDPVHWKSNLFDSDSEKYYLRNNLIEDPYRSFLTTCEEATTPPHYFTEYKANFSGNPTITTASSGRIIGLSRPTDIPETSKWKRDRTQKLRDVVFSHEKDPVDSHLDYNDPKRYNPWPRLKMSYDQMLEGNYTPRPSTGIEYNVTTLLPAVSPYSKRWIV